MKVVEITPNNIVNMEFLEVHKQDLLVLPENCWRSPPRVMVKLGLLRFYPLESCTDEQLQAVNPNKLILQCNYAEHVNDSDKFDPMYFIAADCRSKWIYAMKSSS